MPENMVRGLDRLEIYQVTLEQLERDLDRRWQVEHGLQVVIQSMIDIGAHILTCEHGVRFDDYTQVVDRLADVQVIDRELAAGLRGLPGLRNVLLHQYLEVDYQILLEVLRDELGSLRAFVQRIERLVAE